MSNTNKTKELPVTVDPDKKAKKPWQAYLSGSPTLLISILLHVILAILAAFLIVQRVETKRKQNFTEVAVKSSSAAAAQAQHQVEMTKKKNAMTTPDITQRITTTGLSPITMPEISMPSDSTASSSSKMGAAQITGMGSGTAPGTGVGLSVEQTTVQIDTAAIAATAFGLTNGNGLGLAGHFYDLKQTRDKRPTNIEDTPGLYYKLIQQFEDANWPNGFFNDYFTAKQTLYLPQLFVPEMPTEEAPKAFGVDKECKSGFWVALYKGSFIVPKTGTYRFIAFGDAQIQIRVNHKDILKLFTGVQEADNVDYKLVMDGGKLTRSDDHTGEYYYPIKKKLNIHLSPSEWMNLEEGHVNDIQVLIGDNYGVTAFWMLVEEKDYPYHKTPEGYPILPLFKVSTVRMPDADTNCPPYDKRYMGWTTTAEDDANGGGTPAAETPAN